MRRPLQDGAAMVPVAPLDPRAILAYYEEKGILQLFQEVTAGLFRELPADPFAFLQKRLEVVEPQDRL
jgi:hypothetical protein